MILDEWAVRDKATKGHRLDGTHDGWIPPLTDSPSMWMDSSRVGTRWMDTKATWYLRGFEWIPRNPKWK